VVVTATGTIRNIPTEVRLGPEDGMPRECVLALDNIERVSAAYFQRYITSLSSERMREVCRALGIATGCQPA
jgi:mRNA interferase MazF